MVFTLVKRALVILVGSAFSQGILLLFEFAYADVMGAARYGEFAICFSLMVVASTIALSGIDFGVVQYLSVYQEQHRSDRSIQLVWQSMTLCAVLGLIAGGTLYVLSDWMAVRVYERPGLPQSLRLISVAIPLAVLNQCMSSVFRGLRQFRNNVVVSGLTRNVCVFLSLPVILVWQVPFEVVVWFLLLGEVLSLIYGVGVLIHTFSLGALRAAFDFRDWTSLRDVVRFSYLLAIWNLFQKAAGRSQVLVAGLFLSPTDLGVFALMLRVLLVFTFFQSGFNQTMPVEFAKLRFHENHAVLRRMFLSVSNLLLVVSLVVAVPIVADPSRFLGFVGNDFGVHGLLILPLVFAQIVNVGTGPVGHLLIQCGRQSSIMVVAVVGTFTQIILAVLLMRRWGLLGAVLTETSTILIMTGLRSAFSYTKLAINPFGLRFGAILAAGMLSLAVAFGIAHMANTVSVYLGGVAAGALMFMTLMLFILRRDEELKQRLFALWSRSKRARTA